MKWCSTDDGKYRIESMSAATFPGALALLRDEFFLDEAICVATEADKDPLAGEELLELCANTALDGISLVAVENDTGEVVACVFNQIQVAPSSGEGKTFFEIFAEERCKRGPSRAIVDFMVELDQKCNFYERYGVDCSVEITFLGTRRAHRRKGLAKLICKTSVELAKKVKDGPVAPMTVEDLGPKYSFMTPSKPIKREPKICHGLWSAIGSQKAGKACGFTVLETVSFKDYVYNGKTYAERLGFEGVCEGAARRIDSD